MKPTDGSNPSQHYGGVDYSSSSLAHPVSSIVSPSYLESPSVGMAPITNITPVSSLPTPPTTTLTSDRFSPFKYNRKALLITTTIVSLMLVVGLATYFFGSHATKSSTTSQNSSAISSQYAVGNLPLSSLAITSQLKVGPAEQLTINGQLVVNDTVVLAPGIAPTTPLTGQFYYNKTTNQPYYYNGTTFVSLQPTTATTTSTSPQSTTSTTTTTPTVTSLASSTGAITLGQGLAMTANQLDIPTTFIQSQLTSLNATNLTTGTLPNTRLSPNVTMQGNTFNSPNQLVQLSSGGLLPTLDGSNLTNINLTNLSASNLTTGTLADARLTTNVTVQGNTFNGVSQLVQTNVAGELPVLSGTNLTSLNGSNISSGTVADARLSANVPLLGATTQTFTGANTFSSASNSFTGNGAGLTSLNGTNITTGTVANAQLTTNVTLQGNTFNGLSQLVQTTSGGILPVISGTNLTSLNATNISSGTLDNARLTTNVTLQGGTFNGANQLVQLNASSQLPAVSGALLTALNGTNITSGTVANAQLTANVTLQGNTFNGASQLLQLTAGGILPALSGTNITTLNGTNISSGTINDSRLSSNVALLNITTTQTFTGNLGIGSVGPVANFQVSQATTGIGTVSNTASGTTVTGIGTQFTNTFNIGDTVTIGGQTVAISAIASDTSMTTATITNANTNVAYTLTGGNRLVVLGNGYVGIGTSTPAGLLHVKTQLLTPVVTGGTLTSDATYYYRTFTGSGTLGISGGSVTADVLIVGGGGGGGGSYQAANWGSGGGGGGGGLLEGALSLPASVYTITVGVGGAAGTGYNAASGAGQTGGDSSIAVSGITTVTANGGGGGGANLPIGAPYLAGKTGGSGGGGSSAAAAGSGMANQGYAGGAGSPSTADSGGGGGAGAIGTAGSSAISGNGGAGSNTYSSWLSVVGLGVSGYLAGGGGGGKNGSGTVGTGGNGGGGNGGATSAAGDSGIANTGGGGGGGSGTYAPAGSGPYYGGAGGSGLIIVRYLKTALNPVAIDALVVTSLGNVGIGTATPTTGKLVVVGGNVDVTGNKVINLGTPTAPTDAANKAYVDAARGKVIQVISSTGTTLVTTASGTMLTLSITPSSTSSRIRLTGYASVSMTPNTNQYGGIWFRRTAPTDIGNLGYMGFGANAATPLLTFPASLVYIDFPSTTSACTYDFRMGTGSGGTTNVKSDTYVFMLEEIAP